MLLSRKRFALAAVVATTALLALPALAGANPGSGPELVQRSGRLVVLHADRLDGSSTQQWMLVNGTDELPVRAPDDVWIEPGTPVRLEGTMHDGELVLADSLTAVKEEGHAPLAADPPATAAAPSLESTAVMLIGFSGVGPARTVADPTIAQATSLMFDPATTDSLRSYYEEQTYGKLAFGNAGVYAVTIPRSTTTCSISDVYNWAQLAESAAQVSDPLYEHYVFVFPDVTACGWAGLAEVGGSYVWINGAFEVPVVAHELGHNLGLAHAGGLLCTNAGIAVAIGGTCGTSGMEYKDPFDAMGQSDSGQGMVLRQMSMEHKLTLNLLPASAVQVVSASGTYHLTAMETPPAGSAELLQIPKPGGGNYFVEYRQQIGWFDSQSPAFSGVYIRTESPAVMQGEAFPNADTALIDMHPSSASSPTWTDARMDPQQIFNDALSGILIQDIAESPTDATLSITVPVAPPVTTGGGATAAGSSASGSTPTPAPDRPTAPSDVTAKLTKAGEVLLTWRGSADGFGISGYRVMRNGTVIANTSSTAYVDRAPRPGADPQVTYSVVAVDVAGTASLPGSAAPLRAALLRALGASNLKVVRMKSGKRRLVRVKGTVSDAQAVCRVRIAGGPWHACKAAPSGAFAVTLQAKGKKPVTLSLRDDLGRVKLQTLRVR
jgi:hypothetical protein